MTISASEFVRKWSRSTLGEKQASQSHFNDVCALVGVKSPTEADPRGEWFAFEKGAHAPPQARLGRRLAQRRRTRLA